MSSNGFLTIRGLRGFYPCPMFELFLVCVPIVMLTGGVPVLFLCLWVISGQLSELLLDDMLFLLGPRNLFLIVCSFVFLLGLFLVHTSTMFGFWEIWIGDCNWFVRNRWLKAYCFVYFHFFTFMTSFCSKTLSAFLLVEILSAFFRRSL